MKAAQPKVILNGREIDFDVAVHYMDSEICEEIHNRQTTAEGFTPQEFLDLYIEAHAAKFDGDEFAIN